MPQDEQPQTKVPVAAGLLMLSAHCSGNMMAVTEQNSWQCWLIVDVVQQAIQPIDQLVQRVGRVAVGDRVPQLTNVIQVDGHHALADVPVDCHPILLLDACRNGELDQWVRWAGRTITWLWSMISMSLSLLLHSLSMSGLGRSCVKPVGIPAVTTLLLLLVLWI